MITRQPDATPGAILKIIGRQWRDLDASAKRGNEDRLVPRLAGQFERPKAKTTREERMAVVRSRAQVVKGVLSTRKHSHNTLLLHMLNFLRVA